MIFGYTTSLISVCSAGELLAGRRLLRWARSVWAWRRILVHAALPAFADLSACGSGKDWLCCSTSAGATKRRVKRCEVGRHRLRRKAAYAEALDRGAARRRTENHGFGEADPTGRRVDRGAGGVEGRDALCC